MCFNGMYETLIFSAEAPSALDLTVSSGSSSSSSSSSTRSSSSPALEEGGHLKLRCRLGRGNPPPRLRWLKDGRPLAAGFRTRIKDKRSVRYKHMHTKQLNKNAQALITLFFRKRSTLRIRDLQASDSGNYSCRSELL